MKTNTILIGAGVAGIVGYMYYNAAKTLSIKLDGVSYNKIDSNNLSLTIRISITNNTQFTLFTPVFNLDLYSDNTYIGTAGSNIMQLIPPGVSYIDMAANFPLVSGAVLASNVLNNYLSSGTIDLPKNINYSGNVNLWFTSIPINGNLT